MIKGTAIPQPNHIPWVDIFWGAIVGGGDAPCGRSAQNPWGQNGAKPVDQVLRHVRLAGFSPY